MNLKRYLSILSLSAAALTLQPTVTYAAPLTTYSNQFAAIPNEVLAAESYIEIPVYFNGQVADAVVTYLEKACNIGNANEVFINGYATLSVKAYAYKTGSNIKVGATISYLTKDHQFVTDWWDNVEQFYSIEEAESAIAWPACDNYALTLNDKITFEMPDQNENDLRLSLSIAGVKTSFSRPTAQGVYLSEDSGVTDKDNNTSDDDANDDTTSDDASDDTPNKGEPNFDNASGLDPEHY